jgi:NAD(P)H dehydrogenase (quinone)
LQYFGVLAAQYGMLWMGLNIPGGYDPANRNRHGTQLGVTAQTTSGSVEAADLATAWHLGERLAEFAKRLGR